MQGGHDGLATARSIDDSLLGNDPRYVTSYVNPDADGSIGALAYKSIGTQLGRDIQICLKGELNAETRWALHVAGIAPPVMGIKPTARQACLIDTHHIEQLPNFVDPFDVVAVYDHHPAGHPEAFPNAIVQNEPVGAACTLLVEQMLRGGLEPNSQLATAIALAIHSNTYGLRAPSTTQRDRRALEALAAIGPAPTRVQSDEMLVRGDNTKLQTTDELVANSGKVFSINGRPIFLVQIETVAPDHVRNRQNLMQRASVLARKEGASASVLTIIDLLREETWLRSEDRGLEEFLAPTLGMERRDHWCWTGGILMRKTHILPALLELGEQV